MNLLPKKIRDIVWVISLMLCYPLYALGQIYLFISKQRESEFYDLINKHPQDWINAHLILIMGIILLIPTYLAICKYLEQTKAYFLTLISTFLIFISVLTLLGQYTIDLTLIDIFKLPKDTAYKTLNNIQNNPIVNAIFYDNSQVFFLLKYLDITLLSQLLLGIAFLISKKIPKWALTLYFITLLLSTFGILIDPYYGRIIKRLSYAMFSVSFLPISIGILNSKYPGKHE